MQRSPITIMSKNVWNELFIILHNEKLVLDAMQKLLGGNSMADENVNDAVVVPNEDPEVVPDLAPVTPPVEEIKPPVVETPLQLGETRAKVLTEQEKADKGKAHTSPGPSTIQSGNVE